ncbi:hypothetical protein Lal_00041386 [Lupinus albus]|nr:hypothetical protein Lal_00041386 [Lupinus albus]
MTADGKGLTYAQAGVDIDAGNAMVETIKPLVRSTRRPGADAEIGGFGGLFDLKAAGFRDPILVAANDGVGTKVKIAIETGKHDTIGIDLVAMCVNDLIVQGAEPLFFLDYYATGKLVPGVGADIVRGIAEGCRQAGCALIGGETAEMPGLYDGSDYDLAGFSVGAAEPRYRAGRRGARPPLLRRAFQRLLAGAPDRGPHRPRLGCARALRSLAQPRRRSAGADEDLCEAAPRGFARHGRHQGPGPHHGWRLPRQPARVLPDEIGIEVDLDALTPPPVFGWLAREGGVEQAEMLRTFNCGIGMVVVAAAGSEEAVVKALTEAGEAPVRLGGSPRGARNP